MNLTPYQSDVINAKICPYCKSTTRITNEVEVYGKDYKGRAVIACKNFPACDAYVGTHDDGLPLGRLSNKSLRDWKSKAHYWFDKIWKEGLMKRADLYAELSDYLNIPAEYTHIGMFSEKTCEITYRWSKDFYNELKM